MAGRFFGGQKFFFFNDKTSSHHYRRLPFNRPWLPSNRPRLPSNRRRLPFKRCSMVCPNIELVAVSPEFPLFFFLLKHGPETCWCATVVLVLLLVRIWGRPEK